MPSLPDYGERARRWADALDLEEASDLIREDRAEELADRLTARLLAGSGRSHP
jgi:hypothetical protein